MSLVGFRFISELQRDITDYWIKKITNSLIVLNIEPDLKNGVILERHRFLGRTYLSAYYILRFL